MRLLIGILLFFTPIVSFTQVFDVMLHVDFEGNNTGPYTDEEIIADWGRTESINKSGNGIITDLSGNKCWDVLMPEGAWGVGGQFIPFLEEGHTELYFSYNCMFKPGFGFMRGGKMPGLCGSSITGWGIPVGGVGQLMEDEDGFSARGGFRKNEALGPYFYHHDLTGDYGDVIYQGDPLDVSEKIWYNSTVRIVLNTFSSTGEANFDGIFEGWLDGKLVFSRTDLRWRKDPRIYINRIMTSTFFGGSSDLDKPLRDEWLRFDDFYVYTYATGVDVPRGNTPSQPGSTIQLPNLKGSSILVEDDPEPPFPPDNVRVVESSPSSLTVAWDPAEDNVGVTGYRAYINNFFEGAVSGTSYHYTGLNPETDYLISVSAYDAATNESEISFPIIGKTLEEDFEPPTAPSGIAVTRVTGYSIEFTWNPSIDNVGVDLYEIRLDGDFTALVAKTNYYASGLTPGNTYEITIRAKDKVGNYSPFSEPVVQNTGAPDSEAPTQPTGLKSEAVTNQSIGLSWNPSTDNVAVKGYKIYMNNEVREESSSNDETISGLNEGLSYDIEVSAIDEAFNESQKSDPINVTTTNDDITTAPTFPEVYIVEVENKSRNPGTLSEMKSLGFTELDAYGIVVTQGDQPLEEGNPLFAKKSQSVVENRGRVSEGLLLLYNFSDSEGNIVSDISDAGEPLDLNINRPLNTTWLPGQGLRVAGNTTLSFDGSPTRLIDALTSTNEITLEAWIKQDIIEQPGPVSIVTLSSDNSNRAVMLGHEGNKASYNYVTRLNTSSSDTDENGLPELSTSIDFTSLSLHHVVYTRNRQGTEKLYVNGLELTEGIREGDFSSWDDDYQLVLGNEISGDQYWNGIFYLVAVYNRALDYDEVTDNYDSGFGQIQYTTDLSDLEPNRSYLVHPFVKTDQGIVYGDKRDFMYENVLYSSEEDSIYMAIYPNPSNGDFKLHIEYTSPIELPAYIRIADMSGQVIYTRELEVSDEIVNIDEDLLLSQMIQEGFYSIILIIGSQSIARKLIIHG